MGKTVSEVLFAAAELLEPEGAWMQGGLRAFSNGRAVCWDAVGAIYHASTEPHIDMRARYFLGSMLDQPVPAWNDAPERTQAEVVAKLREAAEKAREQGL